MLQAWLIYDKESADYNKYYISCYFEQGKTRNIEFELIYSEYLSFGVQDGTWFLTYQDERVRYPDFVIVRCIYPLLSKQLEYLGLTVFNNAFISEICNDKAKTYQYVAKTGIPMVDTRFCKKEELKEALSLLSKVMVIKSVSGHGGSEVFLRKDARQDAEILWQIKCEDAVIQPLVGTTHQDLRVYVIGSEVIACVLRTSNEGFRSNFSLGGAVSLYSLSEKERDIVNRIISLFEFGLVGIDFIIGDQGELVFNEIEDVVGARMLYQCSDINIVALYLDYILSKMKTK